MLGGVYDRIVRQFPWSGERPAREVGRYRDVLEVFDSVSARPLPAHAVTVPECVICGGATVPAFIATDRNRRISDERFEYRRCQACDTIVLAAVPEDIGRYYPHEYYSVPSSREELMITAAPERYKLDLVRSLVPRGPLDRGRTRDRRLRRPRPRRRIRHHRD